MEQACLIDTNVVIDYLDNRLPLQSSTLLERSLFRISVITRIELLSWPGATPNQTTILQSFVHSCFEYNLDDSIIEKAIDIRKSTRIKLPDAIIAATALANNLLLITRNTKDFEAIDHLRLFNPHLA